MEKRRKVFIICAKEEYEFIWKHIHNIIDVKKEELLVPYYFMLYKYIDKYLLEEINETFNCSHSNKMEIINQVFNERKLNYFKRMISQVDEFIIIKNMPCDLSNCGLNEKRSEVEILEKINGKCRYIDINEFEMKKPLVR